MMKKILIINPKSNNDVWLSLFNHLKKELCLNYDIVYNESLFWGKDSSLSLIHINFLESIIGEMPNYNRIKELLEFYKNNKTKILVTRHDISNLRGRDLNRYYELIYSYSDGIIHLGKWSVNDFNKRYPFICNHYIIKHPLYVGISNNITKEDARKYLKIPQDSKVILVFGNVRTIREMSIILKSFFKMKTKNKYLITTRVYWGRYKVFYKMCMWFFLCFKNMKLNDLNISNDDLQYYFKSADILLLPRTELVNLNSGVLYLSLYFKLPIIGPNHGVIGADLNDLHQLYFNIDGPRSCEIASKVDDFFNNGFEFDDFYINREYGFEKILKDYVDLFINITS